MAAVEHRQDLSRPVTWIALGAFVLLAQLAGLLGMVLQGDAMQAWYPTLNEPSYAPPDAVFAPVWIALYVLIGVAGWLAWRARSSGLRTTVLALFGVQLVLNAAWNGIFFGLQSPGWGLAEIIVLLAVILVWMAATWRLSRLATLLLVPYAGWVSFATVLTAGFVALN